MPVPRSPRAVLEAAFVDWLQGHDKRSELHLEGDASPTRLPWLLGELATSTTALPRSAARTLGMDAETTVGAAATALLVAVEDPAGPHCRSYRAAAYYLRDHHDIVVIFDEL